MAKNFITRRNFLRMSGASAAFAAAGMHLPNVLMAAPLKQDTTNIVFGGWGATAEDNGVQAAIAAFKDERPDIDVTLQITPNDVEYMRVLLTNFAAQTAPDTSFVSSDFYESLRAQGVLLDITDYIENDPLLGQEDYFIQPQEANRAADDDGRWHGIGSCWVIPHLYYNAELLEAEGITPPGFKDDEIWDWDTLIANAKKLTVDANGLHPDDEGFDRDNIQRWGIDIPMTWVIAASVIYSNGGDFVKDGLLAFDSPEAIEALQNVADLIYVHNVAPRSASLADLGMTNTQMIDSGRLAMAIDGSWALSWMNSSLASVPIGTGAMPKMARPAALMQAHFHSVISSTKNPDEAWEWLRFLSTPFYQTQFLKMGLWLPSQTALSTEEGFATWITEGIHPDNYKDLVTDYMPKHGVALRIPAGYLEASANFITPAFDALAQGVPAADIFPDAVQQANDVIAAAAQQS